MIISQPFLWFTKARKPQDTNYHFISLVSVFVDMNHIYPHCCFYVDERAQPYQRQMLPLVSCKPGLKLFSWDLHCETSSISLLLLPFSFWNISFDIRNHEGTRVQMCVCTQAGTQACMHACTQFYSYWVGQKRTPKELLVALRLGTRRTHQNVLESRRLNFQRIEILTMQRYRDKEQYGMSDKLSVVSVLQTECLKLSWMRGSWWK